MGKEKSSMISSDEILIEMSRTISMMVNDKLIILVDKLNDEFKKYCSRISDMDKDFKEVDEAMVKTKKIFRQLKDVQMEMNQVKNEMTKHLDSMLITLHDIKKESNPLKADLEIIKTWESTLDLRMNAVMSKRTQEVETYFTNRFAGFLKDTDEVAKMKVKEVSNKINSKLQDES